MKKNKVEEREQELKFGEGGILKDRSKMEFGEGRK